MKETKFKCPDCGLPLFRLSTGSLYCGKCGAIYSLLENPEGDPFGREKTQDPRKVPRWLVGVLILLSLVLLSGILALVIINTRSPR